MPNLSSYASRFRRGEYRFNGYISTVPQTVVLAGTVSAAPTYPALTLSYTLSGGGIADVAADMTVYVYSSAGVQKAVLRVASGGTITSTSLPVNEFARGVYDVAIGDTFEVRRDWRIWDRLVSATAALKKDSRITYSDQLANPGPVCNSGGPVVDFLDEDTGTLPGSHDGSTSFTVDPDSGGSITHSWDFKDATPASSSATAPSGIAYPPGFRWIDHTATDASSSKSTVQRVPVWAHERAGVNAPLKVQFEGLDYNHARGWGGTFKLPVESANSILTLPDGALVVSWVKARYGAAQVSYGSNVAGRSHILFVGYLVRETITIDPETDECVFECTSPLGILEQTPALPQLMLNANAPSKWSQVKALTVARGLWYLLHWGATADVVHDLLWFSGSEYAYSRLAIDNIDTIAGQLRDLADSINVQLVCDRLGRLLLVRDPHLMSAAERSALTTSYGITTSDLFGLEMTREHRGSVKTLRGEGITKGSTTAQNNPVFSNAPGNAPASFGIGTETLGKQIVNDQADLNARAGRRFARVNAMKDGRFVPQGMRLEMPPGYIWLDPALREWYTLTLPQDSSRRGIAFDSGDRFTAESVSITFDEDLGIPEINLTLDHETDGPPGVTYLPPKDTSVTDFTPPSLLFPDFDYEPTPAGGYFQLRPGAQTLAAIGSDSYLYITTDFETPSASGGPAWVRFLLSLTGTPLQFVVQANSPGYMGTGTAVNGWIITSEKIYKIDDIFGARTLTDQFTFRATSGARSADFSWAKLGHGCVCTHYNDGGSNVGVYATYTLDGVNWATEVLVGAAASTTGVIVSPGGWVSSKRGSLGHVYTTAYRATDLPNLYKSTDGGATWTQSTDLNAIEGNNRLAGDLHFPHMGNDGNTIFYFGFTDNNNGGHRIGRCVNGTLAELGIELGGGVRHSPVRPNEIHTFPRENDPNNRNYLVMAGPDIGFLNYGVWTSQTGGGSPTTGDWANSWPSTSIIDQPVGSYTQVRISGSDPNVIFYWGYNKVGYSADFGVTIDDRSTQIRANWGVYPTLQAHMIGICGG